MTELRATEQGTLETELVAAELQKTELGTAVTVVVTGTRETELVVTELGAAGQLNELLAGQLTQKTWPRNKQSLSWKTRDYSLFHSPQPATQKSRDPAVVMGVCSVIAASFLMMAPMDRAAPLLASRAGPSQHHGPALQEFVEWCDSSKLGLNVSKTKEMVVTFSSRQRDLAASVTSTIHGKPVEVVEEYKYLGTIFDNLLKFSANTEEILRRCHQRLYLLGKLNFFGVSTPIMMTFYYAFLESIMTFSITCWFHSLSLQNRNRLQHTASVCSKIIGLPVRTLAQAFSQQALRQAAKIISDPSHILHPTFQ
ncbi:uncharacterized protein LOC120438079 [Oreochromis aureus]|uniref:uncharacterized protein LOC120438079 n=1 Tax=Oreochromis aureus TaxID=47969 RepID=UPI001954A8C6|nr:uncharacterized protein LOC120438079 [Oreochromis aureus]